MRNLILTLLVLSAGLLNAQTLMTVDGQPIDVNEFLNIYNKKSSVQDTVERSKKEELDEYKELFIKFKLKVRAAEKLGIDTTPEFKKELAQYRKQLAESYMSDKTVTEELVKEAYERMKYDVHASHILIECKQDAMPEDTLKAYNNAKQLIARAKGGDDFGELAYQYSDDPSSKMNRGDLGYFSALSMVYAFENAAYNTPVGSISKPVRTRFGYHVLKIHDKRDAVGRIKVGHIMVITKESMSEDDLAKAEQKIKEVSAKIKGGESFEVLASKYSEDNSTKRKGGELPWFGPNTYDAQFENTAFSLTADGQVSEPVKSAYGWHIIKRIEQEGIKSFSEIEKDIRKKVSRSDRANKSKESVLNRIKKEYKFKEKSKNFKIFYEIVDSTLLKGEWGKPKDTLKMKKKVLFKLGKQKYTQLDFAKYLYNNQFPRKGGDYKRLLNFQYRNFVSKTCYEYEDARLEEKYPKFKALMKEYRDGILLFEVSDRNVWTKGVEDTTGLKAFYEENKTNYMWGDRLETEVYICATKEIADEVHQMIADSASIAEILAKFNIDSQLNVRALPKRLYEKTEMAVFDQMDWKAGLSIVYPVEGMFYVLNVEKVIAPEPKALNETRGKVTSEYQDFLQVQWEAELKAKFKVDVNEEVYNSLLNEKK